MRCLHYPLFLCVFIVYVLIEPSRRSLLATEYLDLGLDLHRDAYRQPCHAHRRSRMVSGLGTVQLQDQVREAVYDVGLFVEAGCGVDHPEDSEPRHYPVQVAQSTLEAAEHRQCGQARRLVGLLLGDPRPHLAQRVCEEAVGIEGNVPET